MTPNVENVKNNPLRIKKKGGARPGSGRKKGGENEETKKRRIAMELYKKKVSESMMNLFGSQLHLAKGVSYLYKIETVKGVRQRPELVTDTSTLEWFLEELEMGETTVVDEKENVYYYITVDKPDGKAIDSMLDRVYGRPAQTIGMEDDKGNLVPISIEISEKIAKKHKLK